MCHFCERARSLIRGHRHPARRCAWSRRNGSPQPIHRWRDRQPLLAHRHRRVADRDAETLLRQEILKAFPHDGFLGEEYGDTVGTSGFRWIIDPIDGTRNFVRGIPIWATLVGLEYQDKQILGVAVAPAMGLTYRAFAATVPFATTGRCTSQQSPTCPNRC